MRYLCILLMLIILGCENEPEERIVEVPIPTAPPVNDPPPLGPERPNFVNFDQLEQFALNDINSLQSSERTNTRYLIGCNFYNSGQQNLDNELSGVQKGINMISDQRLLAYATPVDPSECLWRIDLEEIGITRRLWQRFEKYNLVQFISQSTRGQTLRFLTQANQPTVFASSFFTTVMGADQLSVNNGLYYAFTNQSLDNETFFRDVGFDLQRDVDNEDLACAGNGSSQIAIGKTRLICISGGSGGSGIQDGFILFTADTSLANPDSVLQNPFLLQMAQANGILRTDKVFDFAAQEFIFSMPNGLLTGYRLANAAGIAETIAPTDIVLDLEQSAIGLDASITLGACSNCHHQQAGIFFQDGVFNQVLGAGGFNAAEKELATAFYRNDKFQAKLAAANQQHTQALAEIGVNTLNEDPTVTKLIQPLRRELDAATVASYTFLPTDEFLARLQGTNLSRVTFGNLISGNTIQFSDFVAGYQTLIQELLLFRDEGL